MSEVKVEQPAFQDFKKALKCGLKNNKNKRIGCVLSDSGKLKCKQIDEKL